NNVGKAKTELIDHAISRYNRVLHQHKINTDDIYTLFYLAMAYLNRQYYQEGLVQLNEIIKLSPNNSILLKQNSLLMQYMQSKGFISNTNKMIRPSTIRTAKILVVEDSVVTRKVIVRTLSSAGYETVEAKDAEEALMNIETKQLDLILLDIILPGGKDGYAILAEIKATPRLANTPVIMLTSRDSLFDKIKGKVSDADEYLTKPFQPDELLSVVKRYLK
ncbi:partial Phosphate regulon transcriptional regulatory protein PhoB, partial [Patescibacteria group bacterium]